MKIEVDYQDLTQFKVKIHDKKNKYSSQVATEIKKSAMNIKKGAINNLKANGSVVTGDLRRSIAVKTSQTEGEVHTSNLKYARYVEEGTKAHTILPRRKKYLYWQGASHPVKKVHHPGSKAKPYLIPSFEKEIPHFIKALKEITTFED